jgi:hypothetical protein
MLQELMSKFKVGGVPQINPTAMDMSLAHRRKRQMLAGGSIVSKVASKILRELREGGRSFSKKERKRRSELNKELFELRKKDVSPEEVDELQRIKMKIEYIDDELGGVGGDTRTGQELSILSDEELADASRYTADNPWDEVDYYQELMRDRKFLIQELKDISKRKKDRSPIEMDEEIPFAEGGRVGYAIGSDVGFGEPLQPRLDSGRGFTKADENIGSNIDKSLSQLLKAPTKKDIDSGVNSIYKNISQNPYFNEQFEIDDLYMRLDELRQQENQRVQKYSGGSMASKNTWTKTPIEKRKMYQEGSDVDLQMADMMEGPTHTMPDGTVMPGATHGEYEETMPQEGMVPDEAMEEDYTDFVISEALQPEEEEYLMAALSQDDQLSIIVDKVIDTASEFSGAGEVDGPGTPVSDSIPARLSDGEFVMTAKATDAIGADTLDELMAMAEQEADASRQTKAIGGIAKQEAKVDIPSVIVEGEDPISIKQREKMLALDPRLSLFAS